MFYQLSKSRWKFRNHCFSARFISCKIAENTINKITMSDPNELLLLFDLLLSQSNVECLFYILLFCAFFFLFNEYRTVFHIIKNARILTTIKKKVKKFIVRFKTSQVLLEFIDLPLMLFSLYNFSSRTVVVGCNRFSMGGQNSMLSK